jgi:UDP:flavonoid glycosyltransferase YjiC (YdhE family)
MLGRPWVNAARRDVLGLPPLPLREFYGILDARRSPLLYGYSPAVVPPTDLGHWVHVTGYWFLDRPADWEPPAALTEFLAAGPPPVFVTLGRADRHRESTPTTVIDVLARAGQRGILQLSSAFGEGPDLPDEFITTGPIPYDWLFPQVAAAVHHGGAGTTAAALRAGLPSVVVPEYADQPFWARRVYELGAGPPPIPRSGLSAERLAEAIRVVTSDASMRDRATELGARFQSEDGVARAVEIFERYVVPRARPRARTEPA